MSEETFLYPKSWLRLLDYGIDMKNFWAKKGEIPLGTLKPFRDYEEEIPTEEIVTIKFDNANTPFNKRNLFNVLILGASGDGKSLIEKTIWSHARRGKYYCLYFDPKSNESGRAKRSWFNDKLPPKVKPKGIPLVHYYPIWAYKKVKHIAHHFKFFSVDINSFDDSDCWQALGMTYGASLVVDRICSSLKENDEVLTIKRIKEVFNWLVKVKKDAFEQSKKSAFNILDTLEKYNVVNTKDFSTIDLLGEWKKGNSVCISYVGKFNQRFMTFDIGWRVRECASYYHQGLLDKPVLFFFDDASFYAKNMGFLNLASQEIIDIGNNYRAYGLNNVLAVQTLGIVDEEVASTYKYKIISPLFANPESLSKINIPRKAINYLKANVLVKNLKSHSIQFLLITPTNQIIPFYPFLPDVNHFVEVYPPIKEKVEGAKT